jgi:predicted transcriptional regulator
MCIIMDKLIIRNVLKWDDDIRNVAKSKASELNQRILYVKDAKQLASILSSERMSLLFDLKKSKNVSELTKQTGRKQEAISRDATILESAGLITKTKKGRKTFLKTRVKKIEIDLG